MRASDRDGGIVTQVVLPTRIYVSGGAREAALDGLSSLIDNAVGDLAVETAVAVGDDQFPRVTIEPVDDGVGDRIGGTDDAGPDGGGRDTAGQGGDPGGDGGDDGTNGKQPADGVTHAAGADEQESVGGRTPAHDDTAPDVIAAHSVLAGEWGALPDDPETTETYVGTLEGWDDDGIELAVGRGRTVRVPTDRLGLGRGTATQIVERFGLVQHLPLQVRNEEGALRLADATRDRLYDWRRGPERLNVNSTTRGGLRATINRAGHADDIVTIERQGLLEQSAIMGDGTEAPGLLAAIGPHLAAEMRCVR